MTSAGPTGASAAEATDAGSRWPLALLLLPLLIWFIHRATLGAYLFEDDVSWVLSGRVFGLGDVFDVRGHSHFYRPLVGLHFVICAGWLGGSVFFLHAVNIGLHVVNCLLVYVLARELSLRPPAAFAAALIMAVATRSVESVAWISGVSAVLLTTFFIGAIVLHLRARRTGRRVDRLLALAAFLAALLTHEVGVALLPTLVILEWTRWPRRVRESALLFVPHAAATGAYLVISYLVNRGNYVVTEGHYRLGWHFADTLARYLVSLYVGRPTLTARILTVGAALAALVWGRPTLRFAVAFMLVSLLPYCFFTWGLAGRYLYLPGAGFALALASLLPQAVRQTRPLARVIVAVVMGLVAYRFAYFGVKTARDSCDRTRVYSDYVERFLDQHPRLAPGATVEVLPPGPEGPRQRDIEDLLRVASHDPTLRVVVGPGPAAVQ